MTRETKVGLLMVVMLVGVFGFMVYKKMHRPSEALAGQHAEEATSEGSATAAREIESVSPFDATPGRSAKEHDRTPTGRRVTPVAAAAPDVIPDDPAAVSATARNADPFAVNIDPARVTPATPNKPTNQAKPKLPTTVSSDDAFADAFAQPSTPAARPSATAVTSEPTASFDPFEREPMSRATDGTVTITATAPRDSAPDRRETTSATVSDPFEAPLEVAQPTTRGETREATVAVGSAAEADPFESAPQFSVSNARVPTTQVGDTIAEDRTPVLEAPSRASSSRSATAFALDDEPAQAAPTLTAPAMKAPTFEQPVPKNDFAAQAAPTNQAVAEDDRLGGFKPVEVNQRAMNEISLEERTATTAIPTTEPFGEARRPAPATRIDEDFAPRSVPKPLVPGDTYNIEPNDNFWTISRKKYGTGRYFMALSQHNLKVIPDPKRMKPGVTIATPSAAELERAYSTLIPPAAPAEPVLAGTVQASRTTSSAVSTKNETPGFFVSADGVPMYRVGQEDTLSDIAQRHLGRSSRWVQVFEMNRETLTDGNSLKLGTVLRLPGDASRVEVVETPRIRR